MRPGRCFVPLVVVMSGCSFDIDAISVSDGGLRDARPPAPTDAAPPDRDASSADGSVVLDRAVYMGLLPYHTMVGQKTRLHAWRYGRFAFYTWDETADAVRVTQWVKWYERCLSLYESFSQQAAPLWNDPNFGAVKPVVILGHLDWQCVDEPFPWCRDERRLEMWSEFAEYIAADPNDSSRHHLAFLGLGHGPHDDRFAGVGIWPRDGWRTVFSEFVAAVCVGETGGIEQFHHDQDVRYFLDNLQTWATAGDRPPLATLLENASRPPSHGLDLLTAMLIELYTLTGVPVLESTFARLAHGPQSADATTALCDLQNAVADAAGSRFDDLFVKAWGWPNCAKTRVTIETVPDGLDVRWSWIPGTHEVTVTAEIFSSTQNTVVPFQPRVSSGGRTTHLDRGLLCAKVAAAGVPLESNHPVRITVASSSPTVEPGQAFASAALACTPR